MITQPDDDNLTIQLLSYNKPTGLTESFYFLEMSTLQATTLIPQDRRIVSSKIFAYTKDDKYLDEHTITTFKTIVDFNNFFLNNSNYYIHDCNIELENGMNIESHDDGEVSIEFPIESSDSFIIDRIFERYALDKRLINILKNKPGHYIAIDKENNIKADFENFDDYIKNGHMKI